MPGSRTSFRFPYANRCLQARARVDARGRRGHGLRRRRSRSARGGRRAVAAALDAEPEDDEDDERTRPARPARARAGTVRAAAADAVGAVAASAGSQLEGTFDHGEEGYGLWLDPSIQEDSVYAEHWAGHRPVTVLVEPDRIVDQPGRRAGVREQRRRRRAGVERADPAFAA